MGVEEPHHRQSLQPARPTPARGRRRTAAAAGRTVAAVEPRVAVREEDAAAAGAEASELSDPDRDRETLEGGYVISSFILGRSSLFYPLHVQFLIHWHSTKQFTIPPSHPTSSYLIPTNNNTTPTHHSTLLPTAEHCNDGEVGRWAAHDCSPLT